MTVLMRAIDLRTVRLHRMRKHIDWLRVFPYESLHLSELCRRAASDFRDAKRCQLLLLRLQISIQLIFLFAAQGFRLDLSFGRLL